MTVNELLETYNDMANSLADTNRVVTSKDAERQSIWTRISAMNNDGEYTAEEHRRATDKANLLSGEIAAAVGERNEILIQMDVVRHRLGAHFKMVPDSLLGRIANYS